MWLAVASAVAIYFGSCVLPFIAKPLDDLRIRLNLATIDVAMTITSYVIVINVFGWIGFIGIVLANQVMVLAWVKIVGERPHEMYRLKERK